MKHTINPSTPPKSHKTLRNHQVTLTEHHYPRATGRLKAGSRPPLANDTILRYVAASWEIISVLLGYQPASAPP